MVASFEATAVGAAQVSMSQTPTCVTATPRACAIPTTLQEITVTVEG